MAEVKDLSVRGETDIADLLGRERVARDICAELNNFMDLKLTLITVIERIKGLTGCEAVSVRLRDGEDFPYFVYDGFPESFIRMENELCARDVGGEIIREEDSGLASLECMCGNVLRARFDPDLPFFTKAGSFWSNNTSALLAGTTEDDRQGRTRNRCNSSGYESVALVPLKARGEIIGLLQLNDKRIGMFTTELISFMEMIGEQIGLAVLNSWTYGKLMETQEELMEQTQELIRTNAELELLGFLANRDVAGATEMLTEYSVVAGRALRGRFGSGADRFADRLSAMARELALSTQRLTAYLRAGQWEGEKVPADFGELLQVAERQLGETMAGEPFEVECRGDLPRLKVNASHFVQVLYELLSNAVAAAPTGQAKVTVGAEEVGSFAVFCVTDRGVGFDEGYEEKAFDVFESSGERGYRAKAGMGLAICRKLVEMHGGRIWLESSEEDGTSVFFSVRLKR